MSSTKVLWFTGLSGSGKSTLAELLNKHLQERGYKTLVIDGDDVREKLHKHLGFSPEDIMENNRLILEMCLENIGKYDFVLVPVISPFKKSRQLSREKLGVNFVEIFVNASIETCIKRDVKGLYQKALRNEIQNFIGISKNAPYELPENPEIEIQTDTSTIDEALEKIIKKLQL